MNVSSRTSLKNSKWASVLSYIMCLCISVTLIIVCLMAAVIIPTFNVKFYEHEYGKNNTYAVISTEKDELLRVTSHMLDYMKDAEESLSIDAVVNGELRPFFNEKEISHMVDVKNLILLGRNSCFGFIIVSIVFAVTLIFISKNPLNRLAKTNVIAIGIFLALLITVGIVAAVDFNGAFTVFHKLFFTNDLWLLDPNTDLLINIVPQEFFIDIFTVVAIEFFVLILILLITSIVYLRRKKQKY